MGYKSLKDLQARTKEFEISLPLMEGRQKADFERLLNTNVTIIDYGFMTDGNGKEYVAFIIKEDDQNFYFGGMVLTEQMQKLDEEDFGDVIREEGLPVFFGRKKSKTSGKNYTTVEFFPAPVTPTTAPKTSKK